MKRNGIIPAVVLSFALLAFAGTAPALEVGEKAPDFELPSTQAGKFKLSDAAGKKNVVVQFYVLDFTPTWIKELSSSRDDHSKFTAIGAEVVAVSMNHTLSQKAFSDTLKLNFPLLSDFPDGKTTQAYGVYVPERKLAVRSYFIVDKQGVVRFKRVLKQGEALVENDELLAELKKIQ